MLLRRFRPEIVLPIITILILIGLVISIMVPKKVIDTYKVNISEEEGDKEVMISLSPEKEVRHMLNTGSRPMLGIQVALSKNGMQYKESLLICDVYQTGTDILLSHNEYLLAQGEELQYIYIPFADFEKCIGDITIQFQYKALDGQLVSPSLLANSRIINGSSTRMDGIEYPGNIKCMYVYTHDTYPLVYDLRILLFLFLAVTMTVLPPTFLKKKGVQSNET